MGKITEHGVFIICTRHKLFDKELNVSQVLLVLILGFIAKGSIFRAYVIYVCEDRQVKLGAGKSALHPVN